MEKFSAFRDPGTGIQPFLPPIPPSENGLFLSFLAPVRIMSAVLRSVLVVAVAILYCVLVNALCVLLAPVPPLRRLIEGAISMMLSRLALYVLGFLWIPEEQIARKRGKLPDTSWSPRAGDIIVSNWSSWIDILWLSYRFNPIFVLPVVDVKMPSPSGAVDGDLEGISYRPGRKTGKGSAAISTPARTIGARLPIRGFRRVTLLSMIQATGRTPPTSGSFSSFEDIRKSADRPVVVFPECTTSNGRGIIRFARVFEGYRVPVKGFNVFIMCIRYNLPTISQPSLTHPIPSSSALNPLNHLFAITSALSPQTMSVRMLPLSDSPSSQLFMVSELLPEPNIDTLSEICAVLISRIGKMKRIGFGWEDKVSFLGFYSGRRRL